MASGRIQTRFFELAGHGARGRLTTLANRLHGDGIRTTLLESRDQIDLYLLVAEAERWPAVTVPDDCRVWTFERVST